MEANSESLTSRTMTQYGPQGVVEPGGPLMHYALTPLSEAAAYAEHDRIAWGVVGICGILIGEGLS